MAWQVFFKYDFILFVLKASENLVFVQSTLISLVIKSHVRRLLNGKEQLVPMSPNETSLLLELTGLYKNSG